MTGFGSLVLVLVHSYCLLWWWWCTVTLYCGGVAQLLGAHHSSRPTIKGIFFLCLGQGEAEVNLGELAAMVVRSGSFVTDIYRKYMVRN